MLGVEKVPAGITPIQPRHIYSVSRSFHPICSPNIHPMPSYSCSLHWHPVCLWLGSHTAPGLGFSDLGFRV